MRKSALLEGGTRVAFETLNSPFGLGFGERVKDIFVSVVVVRKGRERERQNSPPKIEMSAASPPPPPATRRDKMLREEDQYDVARVAEWIRANSFERIALQIPDELLKNAANICRELKRELDFATEPSTSARDEENTASDEKKEKKKKDVFVLADTTFGSCCVDEVAALHHNADCIVHVGFSCCSKTSRLNARMVYQKKSLEVNACAEKIREHTKTTLGDSVRVVVVLMEQNRSWCSERMENALTVMENEDAGNVRYVVSSMPPDVIEPTGEMRIGKENEEDVRVASTSNVRTDDDDSNNDSKIHVALGAIRLKYEREFDEDLKDPNRKAFVWVGDADSPALTHALLTIYSAMSEVSPFRTNYDVARYCPETNEIEARAIGTEACRRNVKKRSHAIERAKDSNIVGIVVGTLGVSGYLSVVSKLREMIESSGRTCYTVACGKPNPNKLANFPEIETFVLVACELCALVDGKDYLQAIITPHEAALAFGNKPWIGEVKLDFMSFKEETKDFDGASHVRVEPTMSLLTGSLRKYEFPGLSGDDADDYDVLSANVSSTLADDEEDEEDEEDEDNAEASAALKLAEKASQALAFRHKNLHLNKNASAPHSGAEYLLTKRTFVGLNPNKKENDDNGEGEHPLEATEGRRGRAAGYDDVDSKKE